MVGLHERCGHMKWILLDFWMIDRFIRLHIRISSWFFHSVPVVGWVISLILDWLFLIVLGIDLRFESIRIRSLSIFHPVGVLFGGNGICSDGRVVIMVGVKFVGCKLSDSDYLRWYALS